MGFFEKVFNPTKRTPVLVLKDHPDLLEKRMFYKKKIDDIVVEMKKLDEKTNDIGNKYWADLRKTLIERGFIKKDEQKSFEYDEGVLFLLEETDEYDG